MSSSAYLEVVAREDNAPMPKEAAPEGMGGLAGDAPPLALGGRGLNQHKEQSKQRGNSWKSFGCLSSIEENCLDMCSFASLDTATHLEREFTMHPL